jgi:hypothetical protein
LVGSSFSSQFSLHDSVAVTRGLDQALGGTIKRVIHSKLN